ncbi:hypothetical protein CNR22_13290 [Sphingobacteriaceae bacterium]|nr:hypothetical protein CNR22_13290 [Sphingobacteriaceae bacterium]
MGAITKFKGQTAISNEANSKLISADSIPLDSSVWVVEATLNYDFDHITANANKSVYRYKTFELSVPLKGDLNIDSDVIEDLYDQIGDTINGFLGVNDRIKIIDISASVNSSGTQATIKTYAISYLLNFSYLCSPLSPGNTITKSNNLFSCIATIDGSALFENQVNTCYFYLPYNCARNFFTDVQSLIFWGYDYPSCLYYNTFGPATYNDCNPISYNGINNFASNTNVLCNTNKPNFGHIPTHAFVLWWPHYSGVSAGAIDEAYWMLQTTYGVPYYYCY